MFLANISSSPGRPSFFEMIAQHEMMPTLRPAIKYIFSVFGNRYRRFEWFAKRSDELFLALLFLLENHHLRHYDASFSEHFYGLKRVQLQTVPGRHDSKVTLTPPISNKHRYLALFFLVILPYIKGKLDELYKEMVPLYNFSIIDSNSSTSEPSEPTNIVNTIKNTVKKAFTYGYPFFNWAYEGSFFIYQLLYLYDRIQYFTPFLHLQKVILKRLSVQEMNAQAKTNIARRKKRLRALAGGPLVQITKLLILGYDTALDYSKFFLPISIFSFKFLEWWYSEENKLTANEKLPIPPPPDPPKKAEKGIKVPSDKETCPICSKSRTNPAMIPSGYVFCYPCIFNFVKEKNKCPITFIPTNIDQIRKLYEAS